MTRAMTMMVIVDDDCHVVIEGRVVFVVVGGAGGYVFEHWREIASSSDTGKEGCGVWFSVFNCSVRCCRDFVRIKLRTIYRSGFEWQTRWDDFFKVRCVMFSNKLPYHHFYQLLIYNENNY